MSDSTPGRKGAIRRYFSILGSSAKGAVGAESIKQVGQFAGAAYGSVKLQTCPRCLEKSLQSHGNGVHVCVRDDICGYRAESEEDLAAMRETAFLVSPQVLAISKGFKGSFKERASGAKRLSWLFWIVTAMVLAYSFSWAIDANWWYVTWTLLVAVYAAINAIRYAYMSYRLADAIKMRPRQFLTKPSLWFVG